VKDWQEAGLLKPSLIKPIVATVEKSLVLKILGQLSEGDRQSLRETLRLILG
jgi:mRNA interferase MazF